MDELGDLLEGTKPYSVTIATGTWRQCTQRVKSTLYRGTEQALFLHTSVK